MKKIEVKRSWSRWSQSDWTLVSEGPARPVSCNSEDAGVGQTTGRWVLDLPDAEVQHPVLLSGSAEESHCETGRWQGPVKHDRTRPVGKIRF